MPAWLGITLAVLAPLASVLATLVTVAFVVGRRVAIIETTQAAHTRTLETLPDVLKGFVTQDVGKGYQAQLDRLERNDAECEGRLTAIRQEVFERVERMSTRIASHEQSVSLSMSASATAMTRLEEGMKALKESVDRLSIEERNHRGPQQPDLISLLSLAAQAAPLVRQLISAEPHRGHA